MIDHVEAVLTAINALSTRELKRLCGVLDHSPNPLTRVGYVAVPQGLVDYLLKLSESHVEFTKATVTIINNLRRKLRRRKSSPQIIRRNVGICNLRKQDPKKWSQGRLARVHHVTSRLIREVLKEEEKWRKLAATLGTDLIGPHQ